MILWRYFDDNSKLLGIGEKMKKITMYKVVRLFGESKVPIVQYFGSDSLVDLVNDLDNMDDIHTVSVELFGRLNILED
jgi:hypothetical protein